MKTPPKLGGQKLTLVYILIQNDVILELLIVIIHIKGKY